MSRKRYAGQVELLIASLPYISKEPIFALKGGTAINLFHRELPRLSVDIDLTYLPVKGRDESLAGITSALKRIEADINLSMPTGRARMISGGGGAETRILVERKGLTVKIETSPVTRGVVHEPVRRIVTPVVEDEFGFAEMLLVSFEDLFAGKLIAALDRQHPRDLFDVKLLYENEGIGELLFRTTLVYLACSSRPLHELLDPREPKDLGDSYRHEFEGMTRIPVTLKELSDVREQLIADIHDRLNNDVKSFLLSLHGGKPDFGVIGFPEAAKLPAVKWKLTNLEKLKVQNPAKHQAQRNQLLRLFEKI